MSGTQRDPNAETQDLKSNASSGLDGLSDFLKLGPVTPGRDDLLGVDLDGVTVVRLIAEGGMGRVYEGIQQKPRRTVAVKVIRPGVVSPALMKRFQYEAEMLARLTHPGIAQIFSLGTKVVGLETVPYFVMEFIPGALSLTAYAQTHNLSTQDRVALFRKACDAVAHGHHKGVIHRDLKPTNILVDAAGNPKVIDFGVARSTDSDVALTTMHTDVGQIIGTLQYMCPEQFDANPSDIDVRADVYALGVVLYELLTGNPPYNLRKKAVFEAARVVRESDPTPLSSLNKTIRRDLGTIASKCLEKERDRRYSNAAELEADLGRYLSGEPIAASPPRFFDALVRLSRRHRAAAVASVSILASLVLAIIGVSFFALRADDARRKSLMERERAESHATAAEAAEGRAIAETLAAKGQLYRAHVRASDASIYEHNSPGATYSRQQAAELLQFSGMTGGGRPPIEMQFLDAAWNTALASFPTRGPSPSAIAFHSSGDRLLVPPHVWDWQGGKATSSASILAPNTARRLAAISVPRGVLACMAAGRMCEIVNAETSQSEAVLEASLDRIVALAFSPSGSHLAMISNEFVPMQPWPQLPRQATQRRTLLEIWETKAWQKVCEFACKQPFGPDAIAFSPAGDLLVLGVGTVAELRSIAEPQKVVTLAGHDGAVTGVAFSPDGTRVATGSVNRNWSGTVNVWNSELGTKVGTLSCIPGRSAWGARLVFSPDGDRIAITFGDRHAHLWDGNSPASTKLIGHGGRVFEIKFFPDGTDVATCSADFTVRTWNAATGQPGKVFMGLRNEVTHLAIDDDGRIAAVDIDGEVGVWCAAPSLQPSVLRVPDGVRVNQSSVRPDGNHVAACCDDGILRIWDSRSGVFLAGLSRQDKKARSGWQHLTYSPDGAALAATSGDGLTAIWDARTGLLLHSLPSPGERGCSVAYSGDGRLLAAGFAAGKAKVWETASGREIAVTTSFQSDIGSCRVAFGLDGERLATGTGELWYPATGQAAARLIGEGQVTSLAASPDGRLFASTTMSGAASVWDAATGARVCSLPPHHEASRVVGFSPDGSLVATGGFDMIVRLSKTTTGELVHALRGHTGWIQYLAFSRDGKRLVTGSWDNTARVWDTASGETLLVLRGHDDYVKGLAFSPQGDRIYSSSFDGTVRIWGASNRELVQARRRFEERAIRLDHVVDGWLKTGTQGLAQRLETARGELGEDDYLVAENLLLQRAAGTSRKE